MGVITGYTRRTANVGSGGGGSVATTLYNSDDTITDDARTVTLKSGTTASYNFSILNSSGKKGFYFDGTSSVGFLTSSFDSVGGGQYTNISFGDSTNEVAIGYHLATSGYRQYSAMKFYAGTALQLNVDSRGYWSWYNMTTINNSIDVQINLLGNSPRLQTNAVTGTVWQNAYAHSYNGVQQVTIGSSNSFKGQFRIFNDAGNDYMWNLEGQNGNSYSKDSFAIGTNTNAAGRLTIKGPGSTSATTTALFQNSSSVSALKIKDDLYCIFRANDAAIPDGDLANNEVSFYIEEFTNDLHFKVKYSSGVVKTGKINLT